MLKSSAGILGNRATAPAVFVVHDLAGGVSSLSVQIGQSRPSRSSGGTTLVISMLASRYASTVPTSRQ